MNEVDLIDIDTIDNTKFGKTLAERMDLLKQYFTKTYAARYHDQVLIRMDNVQKFISHKLNERAENNVELLFIEPGEPTQNAYTERCNGSIRR